MQDIKAQYPDGTFPSAEYYQLIKKNFAEETAMEFDTSKVSVSAVVSIYVHLINDINGENGGITQSNFLETLEEVNYYFKPVGIKFQLGDFEIVKEYPHGSIINENGDIELLTKFARERCINLFLVDSIYLNESNVYGLTYFPTDSVTNNIFLRKDYTAYKPLLTQLGHFFGLLSTYDNGSAQELVNGSNCKLAGDFICDTYADAGTLGLVNNDCEYTGSATDPNGKYFVPSVANFMTNGPFRCRCIFSLDQYRRMHFYYKNYRSYLR